MKSILRLFIAIHIKLIWNALYLTNITLISLHTYKAIAIIHGFSLKAINERDSDPLESGNKTGHLGHMFMFETVDFTLPQW